MNLLQELFNQYQNESHRAYLESGEVCSLAVSHDQKAVLCQVQFEEIVPRRTIQEMEHGIAEAYHVSRVSISPRYQIDSLTEEYIDSLKDYLVLRTPSAQGYLADSQWTRTDKGLQVSLLDTGTEYLSLSFRQLPELIRTETGNVSKNVQVLPVGDNTISISVKSK